MSKRRVSVQLAIPETMSANARRRQAGRSESVVSVRMSATMLESIDAFAASVREVGGMHRAPSRSLLVAMGVELMVSTVQPSEVADRLGSWRWRKGRR